MSATREQILAATRQWLKPLAHVLLRSGITWKDFSELTRLVFVEVAQARFGHRGSKPATVSRIAVLTGLARRDVRKLQDGLAAGPGAPTGFTTKGSLILSHWHQDGDFRAADGSPSLITVDGDGPTFSELLRRAGASDVRPGSILKEMIAANAVESLPDGRLRALSRNFVPQSMSPTSVRLWGSVIADLAETRSHNLLRTADVAARFERAAINDRIDPAALPGVSRHAGTRGSGIPGARRRLADRPRAATRRRLAAHPDPTRCGHRITSRTRLTTYYLIKNADSVQELTMKNAISSIFLVALLTLVACGGGGSGGGSTSGIQGSGIAGIQGSGIAFGTVTGFGSIFVNGVEYSTSSATFRIDDNPGVESDLRVGQVVTVLGQLNAGGTTGTATEVRFNDAVEGPISSLNTVAGTFTVLGQPVRVTGSTVFDNRLSPASVAGLSNGQVVEISGFVDANGVIAATRIEPKATGGTLEVTGTLTTLDNNARTFRIGALVVDFSQAQIDNGPLVENRLVEAKGTTIAANGSLVATRVEMRTLAAGANNAFGEIEGLVTRFAGNNDFDVAGRRVSTDASTQFIQNGLTLGLNVKVEVEGTFNAAGVLVARKVELKPDNSARITAQIDNINAAANQLTVFGVTVTVNAATTYDDKSSANLRNLRLADLRTGDYLEVRGFEGAQAGQLTAVLIERDDLRSRIELQGVARNVADPALQVLGVNVTTAANAAFRDVNDNSISRAQFFSQAPNNLVKVRGAGSGPALTADEAELEN